MKASHHHRTRLRMYSKCSHATLSICRCSTSSSTQTKSASPPGKRTLVCPCGSLETEISDTCEHDLSSSTYARTWDEFRRTRTRHISHQPQAHWNRNSYFDTTLTARIATTPSAPMLDMLRPCRLPPSLSRLDLSGRKHGSARVLVVGISTQTLHRHRLQVVQARWKRFRRIYRRRRVRIRWIVRVDRRPGRCILAIHCGLRGGSVWIFNGASFATVDRMLLGPTQSKGTVALSMPDEDKSE